VNHEAIYGTEAMPTIELPAGIYAPRKGKRVYLHVYRWPDTDKLKLKGLVITAANMLTANGAQPIGVEQGDTLTNLPSAPPDDIATVFALDVKE
jgi:hypothetical protein